MSLSAQTIDRGFVRLPAGLVHYRAAGDPDLPCIVLAHGGPGSSAGLAPLIRDLSADFRVIAPDMMGNGDSDPPPVPETTIPFYADCIAALLDELGIRDVVFYGHHTGAQVGVELAIAQPSRVRRLVLDGVALLPDEQRREFVARYAPPIVPRADGAHLGVVWEFCTQLTLHFPWYRQDAAHRIDRGTIMPPGIAMPIAVDLLKAWQTYHLAYGAAFRHDLRARLPLVESPVLILAAEGDPLAGLAEEAVSLLPDGRTAAISGNERARSIRDFASPA